MKKINAIILGFLMFSLVFASCKKENNFDENSIPTNFKVEIPNSISNISQNKSAKVDEMGGDEIYQHLRFFIAVGESGATLVQEIMRAIAKYDLSKAMTFSYTSDEDGRTKNITVIENVEFEGQTWMYQLTMTDVMSEQDEKQGVGLQVFWNNNPVEGIAILYPYNINRQDVSDAWRKGMFKIEYSETGENGYEQSMIVSVADLPVEFSDVYALKNIKMFVGRNGDFVDVFGNSAHPNATFYNSSKGFDWAFVASGNQTSDLAVAEVGLPPYLLNESSRTVLLGDYSIHTVFTNLISEWWLEEHGTEIDSLSLAAYLENAEAPGFFNQNGFIASGTAPVADYNPLVENIQSLAPYNPFDISELNIQFKTESAK
jgi:hypothetical protein